jgi:hypothetical protein
LKQIGAILLIIPFLLQTFNRLLIVADYYVNTMSFAIHCENKDKPMLHCNDKCQMMKQLSKAEKNEQKNPEQKLKNKEKVSIFNQHHLTLSIPNTTATNQNFCSITKFVHPVKMALATFHPPG